MENYIDLTADVNIIEDKEPFLCDINFMEEDAKDLLAALNKVESTNPLNLSPCDFLTDLIDYNMLREASDVIRRENQQKIIKNRCEKEILYKTRQVFKKKHSNRIKKKGRMLKQDSNSKIKQGRKILLKNYKKKIFFKRKNKFIESEKWYPRGTSPQKLYRDIIKQKQGPRRSRTRQESITKSNIKPEVIDVCFVDKKGNVLNCEVGLLGFKTFKSMVPDESSRSFKITTKYQPVELVSILNSRKEIEVDFPLITLSSLQIEEDEMNFKFSPEIGEENKLENTIQDPPRESENRRNRKRSHSSLDNTFSRKVQTGPNIKLITLPNFKSVDKKNGSFKDDKTEAILMSKLYSEEHSYCITNTQNYPNNKTNPVASSNVILKKS